MSAPPPKRSGLSLYADLLGPSKDSANGATISGAPVKYNLAATEEDEGAVAAAQKKRDALRFQPIKRPQAPPKRGGKLGNGASSAHRLSTSTAPAVRSSPDQAGQAAGLQHPPDFQRSNFEDWIGDDDEDFEYQDRQRQQRKQKKKKRQQQNVRSWDWDDIYDPTQPNSYADYKGSQEQAQEIRDWKARLYYHQMKEAKRRSKSEVASSDEDQVSRRPVNRMFAPPTELSFAPPALDVEPPQRGYDYDVDSEHSSPPRLGLGGQTEPVTSTSGAPAVLGDASGEDAYLRRLRMSQAAPTSIVPAPSFVSADLPKAESPSGPIVPNPVDFASAPPPLEDVEAKRAEAQAKIAAFKAKLGKPPIAATPATVPAPAPPEETTQPTGPVTQPSAPTFLPASQETSGPMISRAPVRYEIPPPSSDALDEEEETTENAETVPSAEDSDKAAAQRSNRPGQKGFAERLLMKYGWEKGQGLGAQGEGITTAIIAKAEKRKKRSDAEGGGFAMPANMGRIVGGKRRKVAGADENADDARYGVQSEVVCLDGALAGVDVAREMEENNLLQQIGDEMGTKFGNVERLFIWRKEAGGNDDVFVKFTSALSALRAVNAPEGLSFAGGPAVRARFFDADRFERGEYDGA